MSIASESTVTTTDLNGKTHTISISQLQWRPTACAIVIHRACLLLVKDGDAYHLPGGGIELGELPEKAAIREVKEETGLIVTNIRLADSTSNFFTWHDSQTGQWHHYQPIILYYSCKFVSGTLSTDGHDIYEKASRLKPEWVPIASLDNIAVATTVDWRPIVARVLSE